MGRCWEADDDSSQVGEKQVIDVQGRLKAAAQFWVEVLHAKPPVIDWIQEGYKLPLISIPPTFFQANHKSAIDNSEYVSKTIKDLLNNRCIQEVASRPHICSPLSVVSNDMGKKQC